MQPATGAADISLTSQTSSTPQPSGKPAVVPALHELEDLLFDLHASGGIDPNLSHDKLEAIQKFLHEHARERKTHEQFVGFFERHALPMQAERPNLLALPMVDSRSRSVRAPLLIDPLLRADAERLQPAAAAPEPVASVAVASREKPRGVSWFWALGAGAVAGLAALGIGAVIELRSELQQLRAEATHGALQLEQLRAETERLRGEVQQNVQAVTRTEHKTQLLLQSVASPFLENARIENSR